MKEISEWYKQAKLDSGSNAHCEGGTRCPRCEQSGICDSCDTVDGRSISEVSDYASTCDGGCMELTHHQHLTMDPHTQLGYCDGCIQNQPPDVRKRLEAVRDGTWEGPLY